MNFNISEFIIDKDQKMVDLSIADKIIKYHIAIIQPIRDEIGCAIDVSKNSGYRSVEWEIAHNRSGTSQHCFIEKGAADYKCSDKFKTELLWQELKKSQYKRVCYYPNNGFIHCDHKGKYKVNFICHYGKKWERI